MKTHRALPLAAALVLLSELPLAVHTANRDERLPRKTLPRVPAGTGRGRGQQYAPLRRQD